MRKLHTIQCENVEIYPDTYKHVFAKLISTKSITYLHFTDAQAHRESGHTELGKQTSGDLLRRSTYFSPLACSFIKYLG